MYKSMRYGCAGLKLACSLPVIFCCAGLMMPAYSQDLEKPYTLVEVSSPSENTVTKLIYNQETGLYDAKYYTVQYKKNLSKGTNPDTQNWYKYTEKGVEAADEQNYDFVYAYNSNNGNAYTNGAGVSFKENEINEIKADFINNSKDLGGAIYSEASTIENIEGNFIGNYSEKYYSGGAVYNTGQGYIGTIEGNFIKNSAYSSGGAIYNNESTIDHIKGDFIENSAKAGGAIYNYAYAYSDAVIKEITSNFYNNKVENLGGAIYNAHGTGAYEAIIENITGDFSNNKAGSVGGAIYNNNIINSISNSNFIQNSAGESGGAIYNNGEIETITNSNFVNNYAGSKGGAIWSDKDINIIATDGYTSVIAGNRTDTDDNAIYMAVTDTANYNNTTKNYTHHVYSSNLTFDASNNGAIIIEDKISGETGGAIYTSKNAGSNPEIDEWIQENNVPYEVNFTGDSTGKIILNNDVQNSPKVSLNEITLKLGARDNVLSNSHMNFNSGTFDMINNQTGNTNFASLSLNGSIKTTADVDLKNVVMDRITANGYNITNGTVDVAKLNLLSDAKEDKTTILYADKELAPNVIYSGEKNLAYSPIYKYDVSYDVHSDDNLGYFTFLRGSSGNYTDFNPSVIATPAATVASAYTAQLNTFNYAFRHSTAFMNLSRIQKAEAFNQGKYAFLNGSSRTDAGVFSPLYTKLDEQGFWIRPYTSFESIPIKNGPKVSDISYGTLVGYDSNLRRIKNGWYRVLTGYLGYNGSSQRYSGIDTYLNGGTIGATTTLYKGNFFNAITAAVGAGVGNSNTMYGNEDFTILNAGVADKLGYNLEFKDGRFIIQPNLLLSYSFLNTFDYTNAAGVRIDSDPLNAFQVAPGVKFILNTENGWQPYLAVNMVWNIMDKQKVKANGVRLPDMSLDPYVQYGVGLQKLFKEDKITAFGQVMINNGGRNGVSLNAGIRFSVGKDPKKK